MKAWRSFKDVMQTILGLLLSFYYLVYCQCPPLKMKFISEQSIEPWRRFSDKPFSVIAHCRHQSGGSDGDLNIQPSLTKPKATLYGPAHIWWRTFVLPFKVDKGKL